MSAAAGAKALQVVRGAGTPADQLAFQGAIDAAGGQYLPGVYNFNPANLRNLRKAKARVAAGEGNGKIAFIGDSTNAGYTGVTGQNFRAKSYIAYATQRLKAMGIKARYTSIWGASNRTQTPADYMAYNPEVTLGAGWVFTGAGGDTIGGPAFYNNSAETAMTWTPSEPCDRFDVYYYQNTGTGYANLSAAVDGTAKPQIVTSGPSATVVKVTVDAGAVGTHTLSLSRVVPGGAPATAQIYLIGVEAYSSADYNLSMLNMGWAGSTTANWNSRSSTIRPYAALPIVAPDCTFINLGINDRNPDFGPIASATYMANLDALITVAKQTGDCILMVPFPSATNKVTAENQEIYNEIVRQLGRDRGCAVIDVPARWISQSNASALGWYGDGIHPNARGYADFGAVIANIINAA